MQYTFSKTVKENDSQRAAFNALTQQTFGFDFEDWYSAGHWGNLYIPHTLFDGEKAISNVSVNLIQFDICGEKKKYIQLGTVMTDEICRGQGLNRRIMEQVLAEYADKADGIYLFANDSVLDYYPKFGFQAADEWEYYLSRECLDDNARPVADGEGQSDNGDMGSGKAAGQNRSCLRLEKADMDQDAQRLYELIQSCAKQAIPNPNDGMYMDENLALYQFWMAAGFGDSVYCLPEKETFVIAELEGQTLRIQQIFGRERVDMKALAKAFEDLLKVTIEEVVLGFTPAQKDEFLCRKRWEEDCTLFVLGEDLKRIEKEKMMFPILSHA